MKTKAWALLGNTLPPELNMRGASVLHLGSTAVLPGAYVHPPGTIIEFEGTYMICVEISVQVRIGS